ncbi:MAG: methionine synthase [Candidatus Riflebacteria bacterium]|nr:methionine synthase [Candidatus Riflebacteria bacterium]
MSSVKNFINDISEKILVFDGSMGVTLQAQGLSSDDFGGKDGCNEALNLFSPQAVRKVHYDFLRAGCRAVETNTFSATRIVLAEYGLEEKVGEINRKAVQIAREAIEQVGGKGPYYITGSLGPTSKLPTLGQISFDDMSKAYEEQVEALLKAEADILLVETCQDILQTKAALYAISRVFKKMGILKPVMVSVTVEPTGTMLLGTDIGAVATIIEPFDFVLSLGINCATGPLEMIRHVNDLSRFWPRFISVMPNAGLPENVNGKAFYKLTPGELAEFQKKFVTEAGVNIVGGCCGTTPAHLEAVANAVKNIRPLTRNPESRKCAASLYQAVSLTQEPPPCLIGERTNANGSRQFRDLLLKDDWDGMVAIAREQAKGGAHLLDVCTAFVGRDENRDMEKLIPMLTTQVKIPLVIDSTEPSVIETILKRYPGLCIINSVNLEDGGKKARQVAKLIKDFGALLICLSIDESGMAKTLERKLSIAQRLFDLLTKECGLRAKDLIFDPLTFTLASGEAELRSSTIETLNAIEALRKNFPESSVILGLSNVSFGLKPEAREVLNSIFLGEAVKKGLTLAIVNPSGILPIFKIPPEKRNLALNLIYNETNSELKLSEFMKGFSDNIISSRIDISKLSPEETLERKIIDGDRSELPSLVERIRENRSPIAIVNEILIPAMKKVGELFGKGEIQLPFVLQSAEVMKAAVGILEPYMEKHSASSDKKIILATVQGDVHDIGKNLVSILLTNNGFEVIDLGIKIDIDTMIRACRENNCDVIGMSGLLVRSTQIMKENLEELNRRGLKPTVILGGAALTKPFVENDLAAIYKGKVFYAPDAFSGLQILSEFKENPKNSSSSPASSLECCGLNSKTNEKEEILDCQDIPNPPYFGSRTFEIDSKELFSLIDRETLFKFRWQYRKGKLDEKSWNKLISEEVEPCLQRLLKETDEKRIFQPKISVGYFKCRSESDKICLNPSQGSKIEWTFPRGKKAPKLCISDFFSSKKDDMIAIWSGTIGKHALDEAKKLYNLGKYREYLHLYGLSMEFSEACAEWAEQKIADDLGFRKINGKRRGIRFSFGYPSCPDLSQQKSLLELLNGTKTGISLTEIWEMVPEASVTGIFIHHPQAKYFVP